MPPGERSLRRPRLQGGFTYVLLLAAIAVLGTAGAAVGKAWSDDARRDREAELLRIGALYAEAIAAYRAASPSGDRSYPRRLDDLLIDARHVGTRRHLRRLYPDPIQPAEPWGLLLAADGGIRGVHSTSPEAPLRAVPLERGRLRLPAARRYSQWHFTDDDPS